MPLPTVGQVITILPVAPATEKRQGICKFVGETQFSQGLWVGVELIGSQGKNNGTVNGVQYFNCEPGKGVFIRPELVEERSSETSLQDSDTAKQTEELRQQLEEVNKRLDEKEKELAEVVQAKESLELDTEIAQEEKLTVEEELEGALAELQDLKATADPTGELKEELERVQGENHHLKEENKALMEQLEIEAKSSEMIEQLTDAKLELQEKNDVLTEKLNKLRADFDELQTFADIQDEELDAQRNEIELHQSQLEELVGRHEGALEVKQNEYNALHKQVLQQEQELKDLHAASSENQEELARDLRRMKEEVLGTNTRALWDSCHHENSTLRLKASAELLAETANVFTDTTTSLAQVEQVVVLNGCRKLIETLSGEALKKLGRSSHHVEVAIALAVLHLKVGSLPAFSFDAAAALRQISEQLEGEFISMARSGEGPDAWSQFLSRTLQLVNHISKASQSVVASKAAMITGDAGVPVFEALRFMVNDAKESLEAILDLLMSSADADGAAESAIQSLKEVQRYLAEVETPLQGISALFQERTAENVMWSPDATQLASLALAEAHALVMPLRSAATRCFDIADAAERGITKGFWGSATEQLFTWLTGAPRPEDTILRGWLPATDHGLKLQQLGTGLCSGLKQLWNLFENNGKVVGTGFALPVLELEDVMGRVKSSLQEAKKSDTGVSSEKVAEAKAKMQTLEKELAESKSKLDRSSYEVGAQKARCTELESVVQQLRKSESEARNKHMKLTQEYTTAFAEMEKEERRLQEELKEQRRLTQEASSIAPLSQWERKQFKHTIEVYRATAQEALQQTYRPLQRSNVATAVKKSLVPLNWTAVSQEALQIKPLPGR